jgi:hypothetical protein
VRCGICREAISVEPDLSIPKIAGVAKAACTASSCTLAIDYWRSTFSISCPNLPSDVNPALDMANGRRSSRRPFLPIQFAPFLTRVFSLGRQGVAGFGFHQTDVRGAD